MKKILLFAAACMLSKGTFAQSAALVLDNQNQDCDVWVNINAVDNNLSDGTPCDIITCVIIVPAATSYTFADPSALYTAPGTSYCGETVSFTPAALATELASTNPQWAWTDAIFQYHCPSTDCAGGGGYLSGSGPATCFPGNCRGAGLTWTAVACNPPFNGAYWKPTVTCVMTDVTVTWW